MCLRRRRRPSPHDADDGHAYSPARLHQIRSRLRQGAWRSRMVDPGHQVDERFHGLACWRHRGPNHRSTSAAPSGRAGIAMNNAVCISFVGHAGVTAPIGRCAASRFLQPDGPKKVPCSAHARRGPQSLRCEQMGNFSRHELSGAPCSLIPPPVAAALAIDPAPSWTEDRCTLSRKSRSPGCLPLKRCCGRCCRHSSRVILPMGGCEGCSGHASRRRRLRRSPRRGVWPIWNRPNRSVGLRHW